MSHPGEPLEADPSELHSAAARLDGHTGEFRSAQDAVRSRAAGVVLGSGVAGAALAGLLAAWDSETARLGAAGVRLAEGHRQAAQAYVRTDADGAGWIGEAGLNAEG
ncbi:ESX-1 secretion-associated protein [Mycolicibacterium sp. S2-37]|uniref:type VII secretion target n=1 Tax=Mycolicibacterium sp. S2-37 TaxID=2810297 RepID=UPI001A94AD2F|nr:type VII secretion target [Mycolicibacterium sp. S2-37]MBO0678872.1 ESX-1 secretion-associated protein [Mycolicibacterium sp. S2-37]